MSDKRDGSSNGGGVVTVTFSEASGLKSSLGALEISDLQNEALFALRDIVLAEIDVRVADCSALLNRAGAKRKRAPRAKKVTP